MQRKPRQVNNAVINDDVTVDVQYSQGRVLNRPYAQIGGRIVMTPGRPVSKVTFSGEFFPLLYTTPACVTACQSDEVIGKSRTSNIVWVFRHVLKSGNAILFDRTYERSSTINVLDGGMVQIVTANALEIRRASNMENVTLEVQLVDVRSAQTGASVLRDSDELSIHLNAGYELVGGPGPGPGPCDCE